MKPLRYKNKIHTKKSSFVDEMVFLHIVKKKSTTYIAKKLKVPKNNVINNLRYRGVLKQAMGRDVEEAVSIWYEKKGYKVERQRGDAPFDLLINNERHDVKPAHLSFNKKRPKSKGVYKFQLQSRKTRISDKNFEEKIDWFLLVLLDEVGKTMYKIRPFDIKVKYNLSITITNLNRLPLQFIGSLEEKG